MAPALVFTWLDRRVAAAGSGVDIISGKTTLESVALEAEEKMGLPPGSYDFYDTYGKVEAPEDLKRAMKMAGDSDCVLEIREHRHFVRIRELQAENQTLNARLIKLEGMINATNASIDGKIEAAKVEVKEIIFKTDRLVKDDVIPALDDLRAWRTETNRVMAKMQQKMGAINVEELKEIARNARALQEEVKNCVLRVNRIDEDFQLQRKQLKNDMDNTIKELIDLRRYIQGKIDMLIDTDADLRRDVQLVTERLAVAVDDHRLLQEELQRLTNQCAGALEESEELRDLLGTVREDNKYIKAETGSVLTRVGCLEGQAVASWEGFSPGILYFRHWHSTSKGTDVQLNSDRTIAIGRGFLASTGVVVGSSEGLVVADGPCRRFGTPGYFSSYYEVELDEICAAPEGAGGLYVGYSIHSAEEIAKHPKQEFDGWMMGGNLKALVCRQGHENRDIDPYEIPETFKPGGVLSGSEDAAQEALRILRAALPSRTKGEIRPIHSCWPAGDVKMGDRIGVLFRAFRDGGAKMKIAINGMPRHAHEFKDAPPAEAIGFLTPVVRLAGTCKAVKLYPGLVPSSKILADDEV